MIGKLQKEADDFNYRFVKFKTNITHESKFNLKQESSNINIIEKYYFYEILPDRVTLNNAVQIYENKSTLYNWILRIFALLLHYSSTLALVMCLTLFNEDLIFLGKINTVFLLYFSFLFALASHLFFFGIAWIKVRPMLFIIILGYIIILVYMILVLRNNYL